MKFKIRPFQIRPFNFKAVLMGGLLGSSLLLIPFATQAQESTSAPRFPILEQLNITPEQEAQMAQIRQNTRAQLESLLSAEQQETFKTQMAQGVTLREAIAAMNLSTDQRTQLRTTLQSARQSASEILTPEQRQQARALLQTRQRER